MKVLRFFKSFEFLIPFGIIVIDLVSKKVIKSLFVLGESKKVLGNFFKLTYIENAGIAFGFFSSIPHNSLIKNLVFTFITLAAVGFIFYLLKQTHNKPSRLALCFVLGGALGNIIERIFGHLFYSAKLKIFYGKVVDFLDFGFGEYRWPSFNVADSFITVGVIFLMIYTLFFENKKNQKTKKR